MQKGFVKNKEDFTCENCGYSVIGDGYTNHCPECFFSKHVDIQPGDRAQICQGMMKPVEINGSTNNIVITHMCQICGFRRNNKIQEEDNMDSLIEVINLLNSQK